MNSVSENALLKENAGLRHRRPKNETKSKELKNSKLASVSGAHVARKRSIPAIGATDIFLRLSVFFLVFYWPVGAEVPPPSFGGRFRCAATPAGHRWGGGVIENDARDCSLWGLKWKVDPPDPVDKHGRIPYQPLGQQQQQQQQPRQKKKRQTKKPWAAAVPKDSNLVLCTGLTGTWLGHGDRGIVTQFSEYSRRSFWFLYFAIGSLH